MAGFDAHKNLAVSVVATAPTPATSGTSLTVAAGEGAWFQPAPFNATVWPANAMPTPLNGEVIRVTARATDVLTIARAQEGTTARAIGAGDLIAATITAKTLTDLETRAALKDEANTFTVAPQTLSAAIPELVFTETAAPVDARRFRLVGNSQLLLVQIQNDAGAALDSPLIVTRLGDVKAARHLFERGRVGAVGHWQDVAQNAADYTSTPPGNFAYVSGIRRAFYLVGNTLTYSVYFSATITGAPTALHVALPPGYSAVAYSGTNFTYASSLTGMAQVHPGSLVMNLYRDPSGGVAFAAGGPFYFVAQLAIQIG